jgi:hypothetical protein
MVDNARRRCQAFSISKVRRTPPMRRARRAAREVLPVRQALTRGA